MAANEQHRTLAEFLRSRRERRRPEDLGLPGGGRRRTPGLRREEIAAVAGLSVTWYTWLEQGREAHPSAQVLRSLAGVLGLDEVETEHLFRLAGEVPPASAAPPVVEVPTHDAMLLDHLDPNPAFLVNRRFDVVAWNRGASVLYDGLDDLEPEDRNILRMAFLSDAARATADDWETDAAQLVAFFRAQVGDRLSEHADLIAELEAGSEEFRRLWRRGDVASFASHRQTVQHPKLGRIALEYVKMRSIDGEQTLVAYLAPKGSALADRLAALVDPR